MSQIGKVVRTIENEPERGQPLPAPRRQLDPERGDDPVIRIPLSAEWPRPQRVPVPVEAEPA